MKLQVQASLSVIPAALLLVSCASKPPAAAPSEYQRLADNASKQVVCRYEAVTGSRIQTQVCLTQSQLKDERDRALQTMHDIQQSQAIARTLAERPPPVPPPSAPRGQ